MAFPVPGSFYGPYAGNDRNGDHEFFEVSLNDDSDSPVVIAALGQLGVRTREAREAGVGNFAFIVDGPTAWEAVGGIVVGEIFGPNGESQRD